MTTDTTPRYSLRRNSGLTTVDNFMKLRSVKTLLPPPKPDRKSLTPRTKSDRKIKTEPGEDAVITKNIVEMTVQAVNQNLKGRRQRDSTIPQEVMKALDKQIAPDVSTPVGQDTHSYHSEYAHWRCDASNFSQIEARHTARHFIKANLSPSRI